MPQDFELAPEIGSHTSSFSNPVLAPLAGYGAGDEEDGGMKQTGLQLSGAPDFRRDFPSSAVRGSVGRSRRPGWLQGSRLPDENPRMGLLQRRSQPALQLLWGRATVTLGLECSSAE